MNQDGTLRRGRGVAGSSRVGNGLCKVRFAQSIESCVATARYMTEPVDGGSNMSNHFAVTRANATQAYVSIWISTFNTAPNIPFVLITIC